MTFIADSNTVWTVGWSESIEETKAALRTEIGLNRVHKQFYHLAVSEMCRFILPLFADEERASIRKLIEKVVAACVICRKFQKVPPKPSGQTKGLWAKSVNDIVCADTFFFEDTAIMHFLDLFSGWSLFCVSANLGSHPTPELVKDAFYAWISIFGAAMRCFFSDQGGEFTAHELEELFRCHFTYVLRSPSQSPFTNPVERHNGLAKIILNKLREEHPRTKTPLRRILQEAQAAKNIFTRKNGYSAQFLAFAQPERDARSLTAGLDDLYVPPDSISGDLQERLALRRSAQNLVTEVATQRKLQAALTKGMQGTVTGPLAPGTKVDYFVVGSALTKGHWIGPCSVVGPGSSASNTVYVIRRPNGMLTEAHRHRLRVIEPLDHIRVPALEDSPPAAEPALPAPPPLALQDGPAQSQEQPVTQSVGDVPTADAPPLGEPSPSSLQVAPPTEENSTPVKEIDDSVLMQWLLAQATSGNFNNDWQFPSQELREIVTSTYGEHFPLILRFAYTHQPTRLRKPPRDLRIEDCGERLTVAWNDKLKRVFHKWDFLPNVTGLELGARIVLGDTHFDAPRLIHGFTLLFASSSAPVVAFGTTPADYWIETPNAWTRIHLVPRIALFTPRGTKNAPPKQSVTSRRITCVTFSDGTTQRIEDDWKSASAHRALHLPWTGTTVFPKQSVSHDSDEDEAPIAPSSPPDPGIGPGESPSLADPSEGAGSPPIAPDAPPAAPAAAIPSLPEPAEPAEPVISVESVEPVASPSVTPTSPSPAAPASPGHSWDHIPSGSPPSAVRSASAGPEMFKIGTPSNSPGSPEDYSPEIPRAKVWDGPLSVESVVRDSESIPARTTRSGKSYDHVKNLNFDHRGPRFDPSAHIAVGAVGPRFDISAHLAVAPLTDECDLKSIFDAFFTTPLSYPASEWIDSPTLLQNGQAHALFTNKHLPIFSVAPSNFHSCCSWFSTPETPVSTLIATKDKSTEPNKLDFPLPPPGKEISKHLARKHPDFWRAMETEIDTLLSQGASFGKPPDGAWVFSSRWVYTWKPPPDDCAKARVVIRGYEEYWLLDEDGEKPATDSPTLQRETLRFICFIAAQNSWPLEDWDVKQAFPQANTRYDPESHSQSEIWFRPPHPFPTKYQVTPGTAIRVASDHTHYGLASAPRRFYFYIRGVFQEHGLVVGLYDECLFLLFEEKTGKLRGLCGFHVDDGLMTGDSHFWSIMNKIATRITFGKRQKIQFIFCGVRIKQLPDFSVELDQENAIDQILLIAVDPKRSDSDSCSPAEVTDLRGRLGSVLYVTGNTRPFESYIVSHLSAFTTEAKVTHLRQINKVIKHLKSTKDFRLRYVKIDGPLICYTFFDSNFKKERDAGSQTGSVTLLGSPISSDGSFYFNLLRWSSRRTRRVVHSTLAGETLAGTFSLDVNEGTRGRLNELGISCSGVLLTDCLSLFQHIYSMTGRPEEALVPDYFQLREASLPFRYAYSPDFDGYPVELWWVPTYLQLADNLTKISTPSSQLFLNALSSNWFQLTEFKRPRVAHQHISDIVAAFVSYCSKG